MEEHLWIAKQPLSENDEPETVQPLVMQRQCKPARVSPTPRPQLSGFSKPVLQSFPLNPNLTNQNAAFSHPPQNPRYSRPARDGSILLGMPRRVRQGIGLPGPAFTTPLKANMTPGGPERLEREKEKERKRQEFAEERGETGAGARERNGAVFNFSPPVRRQTMRKLPWSQTSSSTLEYPQN